MSPRPLLTAFLGIVCTACVAADAPSCFTDDDCPSGQRCEGQACVSGEGAAPPDGSAGGGSGGGGGGTSADAGQAGGDPRADATASPMADAGGRTEDARTDGGPDRDPADAGGDAGGDADAGTGGPIADSGPLDGCEPGTTRACGMNVGACREGVEVCGPDRRFGTCTAAVGPRVELCDGTDDDCDGATDEGLVRPCGPVAGACMAGEQRCVDGGWSACDGGVVPAEETCDGTDEDCDGRTDEGLTIGCGVLLGICEPGRRYCEAGQWTACDAAPLPGDQAEDCAAPADEDCDGTADEGCGCMPGAERACGSDVGACSAGTQRCGDDALWAPCVGAVGPAEETCDGTDEDCDGRADEALSRGCGREVGACRTGTETCAGGEWGACEGEVPPEDERCNNTDDDCDGATDEGLARPCGQAVGDCAAGQEVCVDGAWGACEGAGEAAAESCDGRDNDCDGNADEGVSRACGSDLGVCEPGREVCADGAWAACDAELLPGAFEENCDGALDEDCDGAVDEGCDCQNGEQRACGPDVGACEAGVQTCTGGGWGACLGATGPAGETCNDVDDDCDGSTDEDVTRECGLDVGICRPGIETCDAGAWGACEGSVGARDEVCDGGDDDCDGRVDEDLTRSCGSDIGACRAGTETCQEGLWRACVGAVGPTGETCDDRDNDCDGNTDEGITRTCGTDVGVCRTGTELCRDGAWGACVGAVDAEAEACDGANDEDCDGQTDEGCDCVDGTARPCGSDVGACETGEQTCSDGRWGACLGQIVGRPETCNDIDDDCDGVLDERLSRVCGTDVGACRTGTESCDNGRWEDCDGGRGPRLEVCDNIDNDCDGLTDENLTRSCGTDVGDCVSGTETCANGLWGPCADAVVAGDEVCDGSRDEDCDGRVDEDFNLQTDFVNCGACGRICPLGRADECIGGVCRCGGGLQCIRGSFCNGDFCEGDCINGEPCLDPR